MAQLVISKTKGLTLIDMLVAMLLFSIVASILQSFATSSMLAIRTRQVADDLDEHGRIAVAIIARDLRDTGYGLTDRADRGLRLATPTSVAIVRDLDLDGRTASANESVAYLIDRASKRLRRRLGRGGAQPMADNVDPSGTVFRYRDGDGNLIGDDAPLDEAQRAVVRQVEIALRLTAAHPLGERDPISVDHTISVALRNAEL